MQYMPRMESDKTDSTQTVYNPLTGIAGTTTRPAPKEYNASAVITILQILAWMLFIAGCISLLVSLRGDAVAFIYVIHFFSVSLSFFILVAFLKLFAALVNAVRDLKR